MTKRIVPAREISSCDQCDNYDDGSCLELKRAICFWKDETLLEIPEDCPLEKVEGEP